jgi:hypothetical protein
LCEIPRKRIVMRWSTVRSVRRLQVFKGSILARPLSCIHMFIAGKGAAYDPHRHNPYVFYVSFEVGLRLNCSSSRCAKAASAATGNTEIVRAAAALDHSSSRSYV